MNNHVLSNLKLKYADNCRDLGGIKNCDGRVIKKNFFIRGTTLSKLSKEDIDFLKNKCRLATIIDLRCKKEIDENPNVIIDGVKYYELPLSTESVLGISHEKKVHTLKTLKMMPPMEDLYQKLVSDECLENLSIIMKTILTLSDDRYSVFFHCSVGKDRTGIVAALILAFLGVDRKKIMDDYLYTNKNVRIKAFFAYIGIFILRWNPRFSSKIQRSMLAEKEFLDNAFKKIEEEFGSIDNFFEKKINITPQMKKKLYDKFLE